MARTLPDVTLNANCSNGFATQKQSVYSETNTTASNMMI